MNLDEYESSVAAASLDATRAYPANHFAFRHVLAALPPVEGLSLVEIGVGHGGAIPLFAGSGFSFAGIDRDPACVESSRQALSAAGQDPTRIIEADLEEPESVLALENAGNYDVLIAMGVLPHVTSVRDAIETAISVVRPGGDVFLEFRNALFSLVTFNRYTREFIVDQLLEGASPAVCSAVDAELAQRLNLDIPSGEIHPEAFHVPFEIAEIARDLGLDDVRIIPFHFHAGMPAIENQVAQAYRLDSVELEDDASGWKGLFLASAFLLHAKRPK